MATLAGILRFDDQAPSPPMISALARGLTPLQQRRLDVHQAGPVALLCAPHTTFCEPGLAKARDVGEPDAVLTLDGRIDNRVDLLCRYAGTCDVDDADAAIVRAFLLRSDLAGLSRLVGEWSLAFWRADEQRLILASDFMGIRPLYYRRLADAFCWASNLEALLDLEPDELDRDYLLGQIAVGREPNATPYRGIRSVPAGHSMTITPAGEIVTREHWDFPYATVTRASQDEYVEELRRLMTEAVAVRLRCRAPAWVMLSGGFDSSAIYCLADRLISTRAVATPSLRAASVTTRGSIESDETKFIKAATDGRPWPVEWMDLSDYPEAEFTRVSPHKLSGQIREIRRRLEADGASVLLSGRLGDGVMANFPNYSYSLASHVAAHRPLQFLRDAHQWAHSVRQTFWATCAQAFSMMRSTAWQQRASLRELLGRHAVPGESRRLADAYCLPDHLEEVVASRYGQHVEAAQRWPDPGRRYLLSSLYHYRGLRLLQPPAASPSIRFSYPYAHRPLIEFVLGVPHAAMCRPGEPRAAMKAALTDIVPARILNRIGKGYAAPSLARQFRDRAIRMKARVRDLRVVSLGLVDPQRLSTRLERFVAGSATDVGNLIEIGDLEDWLTFLDQRASASTAAPRPVTISGAHVHA